MESSNKKVVFEIVIVLAVLVFIGAVIFSRSSDTSSINSDNTFATSTSTNTGEPFELATYSSGRFGVSFAYPEIFTVGKSEEATTLWRHGASATGTIATTISIPRTFQAQTNFSEARFSVGFSKDSDAIATCLQTEFSFVEVSSVDIGGIPFKRFHYIDAATGNRYDTASYRTVYNDRCYAVETLVHYGNIENYSPKQNVHEFDHEAVQKILDTMVQSFRFR